MPNIKLFYVLMTILGVVIPWYFFGQFFAQNGLDISAFWAGLFVNGAAGGFSADIFLTATVFWVWSYRDARAIKVTAWWTVIPATFFVGLSLALPLYLLLRLHCPKQEARAS